MYEKAGRMELVERKSGNGGLDGLYARNSCRKKQLETWPKKRWSNPAPKGEKKLVVERRIGKVMAVLMPQVKGKSDGALVNKIVRELLN